MLLTRAGTAVALRSDNGHFYVDGDVAGNSLRFVVDTGASRVALNRDDARRAGVDVDRLAYDATARTAGGDVHAASALLPRLRVGDIQVQDVPAMVIDEPTLMPLLGQSFLERLDLVSIEGDRMELRKR